MTSDVRASSPVPGAIEPSQICKGLTCQRPDNIQMLSHTMALTAPLPNTIPNVISFIKDVQARYLMVNMTLACRCGFKMMAPLLDKISADVFLSVLGLGYIEQNMRMLREGVILRDQLEIYPYNGREHGWCLIQKLALQGAQGQVIGMAGISRNLQEAQACYPARQRLATVDDHIHNHYHRPIAMGELTAPSGMSVAQIKRYCKRIFHLTPRQMTYEVRLEKATGPPAGDTSTTDITLQCGYINRSMFNRQFKATTGSTPRDLRITLAE